MEKWSAQLPFLSVLFPRCGQVVGSPDNARRLLENEEALVVFPEGVRGISKTYDRRYQLAEFGLGFMRLALETNTPVIPVAVIGAEEQYPSVADFKPLAKVLRMPSFPILPQLALGMPLPLPTRYRLHFGAPLRFEGDHDDENVVIQRQVDVVRIALDRLIRKGLRRRRSVFF